MKRLGETFRVLSLNRPLQLKNTARPVSLGSSKAEAALGIPVSWDISKAGAASGHRGLAPQRGSPWEESAGVSGVGNANNGRYV